MQKVGTVQGTRSGMGTHLGLGGCICQQVWRMVWLGEPPTSCCRISENSYENMPSLFERDLFLSLMIKLLCLGLCI